ncbi:LytR family transcriptional regulator [Rhodococcus spelaei]|uniref:LytR family transcriptional regulator n=1 Tax=Rhodococcus spelaei TaxID=2546320 RepID=A0A541B1C5_9NOCA|nr:LCP family protein [Rhodococcus spelaei]TQF66127.1 LytR family transcriptional regulator [Rhodococcus spelaei]
MATLSVLVLVITGFAWRSVDSLESNLATTRLGLGGVKDGAVDILMVGTDSRTDAHGNPLSREELASLHAGDAEADNTDTIVLVRIPSNGDSATAISIPRDSYVKVPGIGMSKINAAFGATKATEKQKLLNEGTPEADADRQATQAGREALIKSVADLTGITVDHYAEIGLLGFVLLTDAVGGVDVCLNNAVDEPMSGAKFPAGEQTLTGSNALSFVRQRHDLQRGDLDRIVRQQVFMASLVHQVLSAKTLSNPGKLNQLSAAVQRSVVLDEDWDIIGFARQLQNVAGGQVKFETIPVIDINATTDYGESIVQVDPKAVHKYVASLAGEEPDTGSSTPTVDPSTVTVDVSNDSGIGGLAARVSETLSAEGYGHGVVGNNTGTSVSTSRVLAADADSAAAKSVAAALGGVQVVGDSSLPSGTVRVVIAADYTGPGSGSASTSADPTSGILDPGTSPTPAPPGPAIDASSKGAKCVN